MDASWKGRKATVATLGFSLIGLYSCMFLITDWRISLPLVFFYTVLTFNTFFSVRIFSGITLSSDRNQRAIDAVLVLLYFLLALNFTSPSVFIFFVLLMFITATAKYIVLASGISAGNPRLMRRKIAIDSCGVLASLLALIGVYMDYSFLSSWIFAGVFFIANIVLFTVYPLYRLDNPINV